MVTSLVFKVAVVGIVFSLIFVSVLSWISAFHNSICVSLGSYIALTTMSSIRGFVFGTTVNATMNALGCPHDTFHKDTPVSPEELSHVVGSSGQELGLARSIAASINAIEQSCASFRDTTVYLSLCPAFDDRQISRLSEML